MTDIDELLAKLNTLLSYKDWAFEFTRAPGDLFTGTVFNVQITWSRPVADAHTCKPSIAAGRQIVVLPAPYDDGFMEKILFSHIWGIVIGAETHEAMEQLRVGGVQVYDPHPGGEPAVSPRLHEPNLTGFDVETEPAR